MDATLGAVADLQARGDLEGALSLLDRLAGERPTDPVLRLRAERARFRLGRGDSFDLVLDRALEALAESREIDGRIVTEVLRAIHFSPARSRAGSRLRLLLDALEGAARDDDFHVSRCRVLLALRDREAFLATVADLAAPGSVARDQDTLIRRDLRRVARWWGDPGYPDYTAPRVFGIGLSRTGTRSLHAALVHLGLTSIHWTSDLTMDLIRPADLLVHDAFSDTGVTAQFEQLHTMFPNARFVLTTRPLSSWVTSVSRHYRLRAGASGPSDLIRPPIATTFGGLKGDIEASVFGHHETWAAAYEAHERRVARLFSDEPGRLLRLSVVEGDGWEPLCDFLGLEVPDAPFPHLNATRPTTRGGPPRSNP